MREYVITVTVKATDIQDAMGTAYLLVDKHEAGDPSIVTDVRVEEKK